ncbi:MAG: TetR/AcrR family transcriptional regulator, partial [Planctomycetota bacterium]
PQATQAGRARRTEGHVLAAAEALLNRDPFGQLSMPAIAAEAGVAVGTLYNRFESREALIEAVHRRYRERRDAKLGDALSEPCPEGNGLAERLRHLARTLVDLHAGDIGVLRSFFITCWSRPRPGHDAEVGGEIEGHLRRMRSFVAAGLPAGERRRSAKRVERAVACMLSVSKDQIVVTPDDAAALEAVDLKRLVGELERIGLALIGSEGGAR